MGERGSVGKTLTRWGEKVHWERRVKAVCKPCWEIKYCPYGPLVEEFPLKQNPDEKSCRIFGHDCPVFYGAEPLTETKELRNINREIPRITQFKVLKRENQICSSCGKSVKDEDVEFDHIIPWSKGGSSDEHNIRLLCRDCNRKKGKKFEDKYLVDSAKDHVVEPVGIEVLLVLLEDITLAHSLFAREKHYPTALDICKFYGRRKVQDYDESTERVIRDIDVFFKSQKPREIKQKTFQALKYRWGFSDGEIHKLAESAKLYGIETDELLQADLSLINRLGWQVRLIDKTKREWMRL